MKKPAPKNKPLKLMPISFDDIMRRVVQFDPKSIAKKPKAKKKK
jgi:hypothetical protein